MKIASTANISGHDGVDVVVEYGNHNQATVLDLRGAIFSTGALGINHTQGVKGKVPWTL